MADSNSPATYLSTYLSLQDDSCVSAVSDTSGAGWSRLDQLSNIQRFQSFVDDSETAEDTTLATTVTDAVTTDNGRCGFFQLQTLITFI